MKDLFLQFHPQTGLEKVNEFTNQLKDQKLTMADLKGYFITNQNSTIDKLIQNAKDLIANDINATSIAVFLRRLDLGLYIRLFIDKEVHYVNDLRKYSNYDLNEFEQVFNIPSKLHIQRILNMLNNH